MSYLYKDNHVSGLTLAYLGGGSRGWAQVLMRDLAREEQLSGVVKLYDIDYAAASENEAMGNRLSAREDAVGKWEYKAVRTLEEALTGADFIIASILPGTFEEMRSDVHAPEKYGVYQSVGDSVGPGGAIRSLRTIPMYEEFALGIKQWAPNAWVINYTNPMTVCTRTLYEVFPEIKAFGCCHEVFDTQLDLASMLDTHAGIKGATKFDIKVNVLGINHFTWLDSATYKGLDLMPLYAEVAEQRRETGYLREGQSHWMNSVFRHRNLVKIDLFRRYGLIAAAGDRHLAEFMPPWYLKDPETVERYQFGLTSVDWRIEGKIKTEERRAKIIRGEEELQLTPTGEEGVMMIKALLGLGDYVTNVNLPNTVQMDDIPQGAVVETNALFSRDCVRPLHAGRLPDDIQNLVIRHVYNQESLVKAGLNRDRRLAFNAFANDPQMARVDLADAEKLFDEMIANTRDYLPGW